MSRKAMDRMLRSPTFLVGGERQRGILDDFQRREQHLSEAYHENKPLCFNARAFQKTHPAKACEGHRDADVTLAEPLILGVADGVSQVEDFGIDSSLLPKELMARCGEIGMRQLTPGAMGTAGSAGTPASSYSGPISLLREAFQQTQALGSTTAVLAVLDNSTRIHSKVHPMIAVITVGDCELLILRRLHGIGGPLQMVFHTEMQRIDGHAQTPLQLARVDGRIDANFDVSITYEVIERGSAVHCVSAYEGDIIIMGSDGVFDNLFQSEITDLCNAVLLPGQPVPTHESLLGHLTRCIIEACHMKTERGSFGQLPESPIGRGGKMDDTSVVVGEVVQWSPDRARTSVQPPRASAEEQRPAASLGAVASPSGRSQRELGRRWKNPLEELLSCSQWQNCCVASESGSDFDEESVIKSSHSPKNVEVIETDGAGQIGSIAPILDLRSRSGGPRGVKSIA